MRKGPLGGRFAMLSQLQSPRYRPRSSKRAFVGSSTGVEDNRGAYGVELSEGGGFTIDDGWLVAVPDRRQRHRQNPQVRMSRRQIPLITSLLSQITFKQFQVQEIAERSVQKSKRLLAPPHIYSDARARASA